MDAPFVHEVKHKQSKRDDANSRIKTIQWENVIEGGCSFWFLILCVFVLILFLFGMTVNVMHREAVIYNHAFSIPLAVCQISIIILCIYYCSGFEWSNIRDLITFNKFWTQFVLCSMFNFISFLLLTIHLTIGLSYHQREKLDAWFYANAVVYLFSTISIPFPAISIKLHHKYKPRQHVRQQILDVNESAAGCYTPLPHDNGREKSVSLQYEAGEHRDAADTNNGTNHDENNLCLGHEVDAENKENVQPNQVKSWLQDIKLGIYYKNFKEESINDWEDVLRLSSQQRNKLELQLQSIGIKKIGHLNKMVECIKQLNREPTASFGIEYSYSLSVSASIAGSKPIFRDNVIKGAILVCYFVNFVAYICNPLINHNSYLILNDILYPRYDDGNFLWLMIHNMNQIFLRTFLGMSITSVFFMIVTELSGEKITSTHFCVIRLIWNDKRNNYWIFILILSIISAVFEIFEFRDLIQKYINTQNNHSVEMIVNTVWSIINLCVSLICICFTVIFGGIYVKTKRDFLQDSGKKSPKSPIVAYVLEAIALCICFAMYIIFMFLFDRNFDGDVGVKSWDTIRQTSILILTVSQFVSLIKVKQTQKFGGKYYAERFDYCSVRFKWILHGYYKLNCLLIMYNVVYIFMFKWQYFGAVFTKYISNDHEHIYANCGSALSFSLSAAMLFILTHFLASYDRWRKDQWNYPNNKKPALNLIEDKHAQSKERFMSEDIKREGINACVVNQEPYDTISNSMQTNAND
eukprot:22121_1